jgi:XTP/dITP diphosphohydrolase
MTAMPYVNLLTGNPGKIKAAESVFAPRGIQVRSKKLDIPEIQADTSLEIARWGAKTAYQRLRQPVIREDHSFTIDALGIPGPYMAHMYNKVSVQTLTHLIKDLEDRSAHFTIATVYVDERGKDHGFSYDVPVVLDTTPKGPEGRGWERIFRFPGDKRVFAEFPESDRLDVFSRNYIEIADIIAPQTRELDHTAGRRR